MNEKTATDNDDAAATLNQHLENWEKNNQSKKVELPDDVKAELKEMRETVAKLKESNDQSREYIQQNEQSKAIKPVIDEIRGDLEFTDEFVDIWMSAEAARDKKLNKAWDQREDDPEAWAKALEGLKEKFQTEMKKQLKIKDNANGDDIDDDDVDDDTEDQEDDAGLSAALRASRSAKSKGGWDDVDFSGLGQTEFEQQKHKLFRDMRAGKFKRK